MRSVDGLRGPCCSHLDNQQYVCFIHLCAPTHTITGLCLSRCSIKCSLIDLLCLKFQLSCQHHLIFLYLRPSRGSSESDSNETDSGWKGSYMPCFKMFVLISVHLCLMKSNKRALYSLLPVFSISALRKIVQSEGPVLNNGNYNGGSWKNSVYVPIL